MRRAVGIDLGTSNSAVAVIDSDGRPRILTTATGATTLPSVVWFSPVDSKPRARTSNESPPCDVAMAGSAAISVPTLVAAAEAAAAVAEAKFAGIKRPLRVRGRGAAGSLVEISSNPTSHPCGANTVEPKIAPRPCSTNVCRMRS